MRFMRSIRVLFPLAMLMAVALAAALTAYLGFRNAEADVMAAAHGALSRDSQRLAAYAKRELIRDPVWLGDQVTRWVSDRRAVAIAVIGPDGRVLHGSRFEWRGRPSSEALPTYVLDALPAAHARREVQFVQPQPDRLAAVLGFDHPQAGSALQPERGAIYMEFDLARVIADDRVAAFRSVWPVLAAFLVPCLLLLEVVDRSVTGPLARLVEAVKDISQGRRTSPVRVEGAPELRELALAVDHMRRDIEAALSSLGRQQRHLTAAQGIARLGSWEWHIDREDGWWTDEVSELLGVAPGSVKPAPESILRQIHEDDRSRLRRLYDEAVRLGVPVSADYRLLRADGQVSVMHDEVVPVDDGTGGVHTLRGTIQDISERHAIEMAWRRSEEETRLILDSTLDAVITIDEEGCIRKWNARAEEIFGWSATDAIGAPLHSLIIPERMREAHLQGMRNHRQTGVASVLGQRLELPALHRDGREINIELSIAALGLGGERRFSAFIRDITERKRVELELIVSKGRFQRVVENIGDALMLDDLNGRVIFANEQFCQLFGVSRQQLSTMVIEDYVAPEFRETLRDRHQRRVAGEAVPEMFEYIGLRADGTRVPIEVRVKEVIENGVCIGTQSALRDISERKQAETALRELNDSLEHRISERTRELIVAREQAELASAAKTEFLSRMSHEMRTPMNAVLGFAQLLQGDGASKMDEEQADAVNEILTAGRHLLGLIDEILDLARIETGRIDLALEPIGAAGAIGEAVRLLSAQAQAHDIRLRVAQPEPDSPRVLADRMRLRQILINLLSNAIKYNRNGGSVRVYCGRVGAEAVRISVEDTGHGIDEAGVARLFRPFERLESAYSGVEGAGIGLALCRRLVEAMHGRIGVDSRPGEGSTFWFELPVASAENVQEAPASKSPDAAGGVHGEAGGRKRVLYVEDNPANLRLMHKLFATHPAWQLSDAHDGALALELLQGEPFDLLMLDIGLPGMDGFELLKRARALPSTQGLPIVAISANASSRDIERGLAAGFSAYFTKPFDVAGLMASIDDLLQPSQGKRA